MEADPVEILVHVSARCRADDDKRFRNEAAAILDFLCARQSDSRRSLIGRNEPDVNCAARTSPPRNTGTKLSDRNKTNHRRIAPLSSQPAFKSSHYSQGQVSAPPTQRIHVAKTPVLPQFDRGRPTPRISRTSFGHKTSSIIKQTPIVAIPRTPYTDMSAPRHHPNSAGIYIDTSPEQPTPSTPRTPKTPKTLPSTVPESVSPRNTSPNAQRKRKLLSLDSTPSVIEESPNQAKRIHMEDTSKRWPNEANVSPSPRKRLPLGPVDNSKKPPNDQSKTQDTRSGQQKQGSPSSSHQRSNKPRGSPKIVRTGKALRMYQNQGAVPLFAIEMASKPTESSEVGVEHKNKDIDGNSTASLYQNIYAPLAETKDEPFKTHKVKRLIFVSEQAWFVASYDPKDTLRDIAPFERGYWRIPPRPWPHEDLRKFIKFLKEFIGKGKAGWGTWFECIKANDRGHHELRIWCWGEVVREVWLFIHLQAYEYMKHLRLSWVDSSGNVVVRML